MHDRSTVGFWLSPQQKHLWSLNVGSYRCIGMISVEGPLQPKRLVNAMQQVVMRHEILRTVFRRQPGMKAPFQVILNRYDFGFQSCDFSCLGVAEQNERLQEVWDREQARSFDFENGPLLQLVLVQLGKTRSALVVNVPAVCGDLQAMQNLIAELAETYAGQPSRDESLRYVQFAQWQSELLESEDDNAAKAREFWSFQ